LDRVQGPNINIIYSTIVSTKVLSLSYSGSRSRLFDVYVDLVLVRVKPYVQFFGLYYWRCEITWRPVDGGGLQVTCPREDALARLILGDGQGRWTGVQVGYNRETYL
jgi:hypothetical protein